MSTEKDDTVDSADSNDQKIDIEKCSKTQVVASLAALKITPPKGKGLPVLVELLRKRYMDDWAKKIVTLAECDNCNAAGPVTLEACPFCGEPNEAPASSVIGGGSSEIDSTTDVERASTMLAQIGESAFTKPTEHRAIPIPPSTEDALEVAVGEIQKFKRTFAENSWDIGHKLNQIAHETKERPALWRQRRDENDSKKPAYDTFQAFLRAEIGFSLRMARVLMYAAAQYTRDEILLSGAAKIEIVLTAPMHERKRLMASAPTTPLRDLRKKVRDLNVATGRGESQRKGAKTQKEIRQLSGKPTPLALPPAPAAKSAADDKGLTTLVMKQAKGKIHLYREQKDAKGKLTLAHSVTDAYGWIEGQNGVTLTLKIHKDPSGKLSLLYTSKREQT